MKNIVFIGSHLGYPMDRTPLGGGAMVGLQLLRHWARAGGARLIALGAGSQSPAPEVEYHRMPAPAGQGEDPDLVHMSEWAYARFCRKFEKAATGFLAHGGRGLGPQRTVVVVNDVAEAPDMGALARLGYRQASLWHVDVVDFFNRLYLGRLLPPERLTKAFDLWEGLGLGALLPDILKLVFRKQKDAIRHSDLLIVPSRGMGDTLLRCYGGAIEEKLLVVPWGVWREDGSERGAKAEEEAQRLRRLYRLGPDSRVIMTLSRIAPEKGIHLLLKAVGMIEDSLGHDLCVFICGEPAFMRGASYAGSVRALAGRLRRARVVFPGYLSAERKLSHFLLADLFVSPSIHESYGLAVVEAMQAGLPVLASDHYGVREALDESYGRIVRYEDRRPEDSLAQALSELLRDPARLKAMGALARKAAARMDFAGSAERVRSAALGLLS
ncbi:MAG: glycosyltransferase family 4 protein [Elusimicrobia bacterium]|nr:glycosyltransferase family 4 protein [Elusimicrobiota bacterium]